MINRYLLIIKPRFDKPVYSYLLCLKFISKMAKKERELPEILEFDFIITDESVNRYSWRLLVAGIDLEGFLKNPICCVQHATYSIPVGRWKNLRVEGQELKGTVEFDRNDDDAVKLYWKYKDGFMNAVSLNVLPIEQSEDPSQLLPGQQYPTLTKSEMLEISLVTLPGQKNAVKLSTPEGNDYKLNLLTQNKPMVKEEKTVAELQKELEDQRKLNADNLITIHKNRGVITDGEIPSLKKLAFDNYGDVSQMLEARTVSETPASGTSNVDTLAESLVKLHFDRGAITDPERSIFKGAAVLDYEGTKKVLEGKTGTDGLKSFAQSLSSGTQIQPGTNERDNWTYYDYFRKDSQALSLMEKNEPEKYKTLVANFEAESIKNGLIIPEK